MTSSPGLRAWSRLQALRGVLQTSTDDRQKTPTDASEQNNVGPLGGPVITRWSCSPKLPGYVNTVHRRPWSVVCGPSPVLMTTLCSLPDLSLGFWRPKRGSNQVWSEVSLVNRSTVSQASLFCDKEYIMLVVQTACSHAAWWYIWQMQTKRHS